MSLEKVKVGVVGLGIGAVHVASLARIPEAEVVALADLDEARLQKFAHEHDAHAYSDWRAMLDGEAHLDAVILATPAVVRRDPIEALCERGIALFCEKPPAVSLDEALRISEIIERAAILNTVGFMYRWSPMAERMREIVFDRPRLFARGIVAWPVFDWVISGFAPKSLFSKAACGGPLIEQAIHFQDVLRYITGDEPQSVQAFAEQGCIYEQEGRDCEETTAYVLRHESGMLSTHIQNWSHKGTLLQLQIVGQDFDLTLHLNEPHMRLVGTLDSMPIDEAANVQCHFEEMVGFIRAVQHGDQSLLRSPYADACRSMAVCKAAADAVGSSSMVHVPTHLSSCAPSTFGG